MRSFRDGVKEQIAPVHPDFGLRPHAAVPDGIGWPVPNRFVALEVLQSFWVWPTKV
jgi:hypothetical protein